MAAEHTEKLQENENSQAGAALKEEIDDIERTIANLEVKLTGKEKQISDFAQRESED